MRLSLPDWLTWRGRLSAKYGIGIFTFLALSVVVIVAFRLSSEALQKETIDSPRPATSHLNWSKQWIDTETGEFLVFTLEGMQFRIPKNFIGPVFRMDRPGVQIFAVWPGLSPWPPKRSATGGSQRGLVSRVIMSVHNANYRNPRDWINRLVQSETLGTAAPALATPDLDCYANLTTKRCNYYVSRNRELYDANGNPLTIRCNPPVNKRIECNVYYQLMHNVGIRYRYDEKHIRDWRKIHDAVIDFFRVDDS